ncbi:ATP-dependent DNA ligase [Silvibacterium dinghuense]|uniref:DNA ligase n=2 Tax=Silvibacterium dinghuense TaxID=1560006 RepID=A0A4Q1SL81_9BACT|nr:ATP-dependent DNA ligase [Silvibacterium dinghuense]
MIMSASFLEFAQENAALTATTKKLEKRALLAAYLRSLAVEDAARAALYFAGTPFAETDRRKLNVGGSLLTKALQKVAGVTPAILSAAYRRYGDLGDAAEELFNARERPQAGGLTLGIVAEAFTRIAAARGPGAKLPLVTALLEVATPVEARYLLKLILGDMRTGVKESLVEEAIAAAWGAEPAAVRRAGMLLGDLPEVVRLAVAGRLEQARMRLFHPLSFMLASPVATVEEAVERFTKELAAEGETASAIHGVLEDKYDGIRAQLHCGDRSQPGRVELFSRSREDLGASFPELMEAFAGLREPAILDGEILAWQPDTGRALPFSILQQRIGRKRVTAEMRERIPVVFMAFDALYLGEALLLEWPLGERRVRLEGFIARHAPATAEAIGREQQNLFAAASPGFPRLIVAPQVPLESAEHLDRAYAEARARGNEGVMLKSLRSVYQPGRRGLAWLKLKRELATLDVVVTGAEFGHGRRAGVLSDYTFAVQDGDRLLNVGKAYSGLTDAEIDELTAFFQAHTLEDNGHFRTVEPLKVLEVAFNNVMRSDRHSSGFALRFPRILRIREDKPVEEIDTLARVEEIYASQPDKPMEQGVGDGV